MRRLSASRASTAIAVVAAVVAVLAVAFPGLGFGQTTSGHGGSPSDVYMQEDPGTCVTVGRDGGVAMSQTFTTSAESHLLVYFSFEFGRLNATEEADVSFSLDGTDEPFERGIPGNSTTTRTSGTLMSSFTNVPAGEHTVATFARIDAVPAGGKPAGGTPSADVNDCALTVFVIPLAA